MIQLRVNRVEPFADGAAFGETGAYERVIGTAAGALDPADPRNAGIVGLDRAPGDADGRVAWEADVFVLRPADPARANGALLFEVPNRGSKLGIHMLNQLAAPESGPVNDPATLAHAGDGFVFRRGYTLAWAGWEPDAPAKQGGLRARIPALRGEEQEIRDEFVSLGRGPALERFRLSYAVADRTGGALAMRYRREDAPRPVAPGGWHFVDDRTVALTDALPEPGVIYDFIYRARDPWVSGMGLAIIRDVATALRGHAVAGGCPRTLGFGISQSGRFLRDFVRGGFNRSTRDTRVFDGVLSHVAGTGTVFLNTLFAQPFRTRSWHQDQTMPEASFPFVTIPCRDPATGATGSVLPGDGCNPLLIETNTGSEYWQKGASLLSTDPEGRRDLALPDTTRLYLIAGTQHGGRAGATASRGNCQNPRNPHSAAPALRALLVALDRWAADGRAPAPSLVPRIDDGTLVPAEALGFPSIPGFAVATHANPVDAPGDWVRPLKTPTPYRVLVPAVDADGNERAGLLLPDIAVPTATYTGWNVYAPPFPPDALCDRDGSSLPFARDTADRVEGDPRPPLTARYGSHTRYVAAVRAAGARLVGEGLLLAEDADAYTAAAEATRF